MNDKLKHYVELAYPVELIPDDGGFLAAIPDLPGCISSGETAAEALDGLTEAKELWIQGRLEANLPIPEPTAPIDYSGKFVLRIPRSLHRDLDAAARRENVSLNQYIVKLLSERIQIAGVQASFERLSQNVNRLLGVRIAEPLVLGSGAETETASIDAIGLVRNRIAEKARKIAAAKMGVYDLQAGTCLYDMKVTNRVTDEEIVARLEHIPKPPGGKQAFSVPLPAILGRHPRR